MVWNIPEPPSSPPSPPDTCSSTSCSACLGIDSQTDRVKQTDIIAPSLKPHLPNATSLKGKSNRERQERQETRRDETRHNLGTPSSPVTARSRSNTYTRHTRETRIPDRPRRYHAINPPSPNRGRPPRRLLRPGRYDLVWRGQPLP